MSERFRAVLEEVAAAIGAKKIRSGEKAMKFGRGDDFDEMMLLIRKGFSVMGNFSDRAVNLEFRGNSEIEIDVHTSDRARFRIQRNNMVARLGSMFGRRVKTGNPAFDDRLLVQEEGGMRLDEVVTDPAFAAAVENLEPFDVLVAKDRILEGIFVYDRETVTADEVVDRLEGMSKLATLLEAAD